jgi:hypothetical protein
VVVSGRVLDPDGGPVAGARLRVDTSPVPTSGVREFASDSSARADAKGEFRFDDLPAKPGGLRVTAKGFRGKSVPVGDVLEGIEVRLERQDPGTARRREEIQKEIVEVVKQLGEARNEAERKAITQRLVELQEEAQGLVEDDE